MQRELRPFETYIVAYSGGKDSTATLLWSLDNLPRERVRVVFCDTGVAWPETYDYLDYIEEELNVKIERIRMGDRPLPPGRNGKITHQQFRGVQGGLFDLVRARGMWPSPTCRYCTTYLKKYPLDLYCDEQSTPVKIFGQRAEESPARARMEVFDLRGNNTRHPIYRPVLKWSESQVWNYLRTHRISPNPMYNYATRCGCWCCIMDSPATRNEIRNFCRMYPDKAMEAVNLEREVGHNWSARHSLRNLYRESAAQMELFSVEPRFPLAPICSRR